MDRNYEWEEIDVENRFKNNWIADVNNCLDYNETV